MESASLMELQEPIVPLLHLIVFLATSVMLFVEKVCMAIIILVKLFRKHPGRRPERRYIWEPMQEKDEVLVQIPMYNEKEVHQLSIGTACQLSWTSNRIVIQVLDDSTDSVIKTRVQMMEDERNLEEESKLEAEEKGKQKRRGDTVEERKLEAKRRWEGGSNAEAKEKGKRKQEETGEGTVEVNEDEKEGREKKEAEMVSHRKAKVNEDQRKAEVNEDEKVGEKKQEAETVGQERDGNWKEKTVGEVKVETTEEKERRKRRGDTIRERKSQAKRRKKAEVNQDDEKQQCRWVNEKQQCRWVRSCMAMAYAAIFTSALICAAIFTSALILVALANIPYLEEMVYLYLEETVYLVPT